MNTPVYTISGNSTTPLYFSDQILRNFPTSYLVASPVTFIFKPHTKSYLISSLPVLSHLLLTVLLNHLNGLLVYILCTTTPKSISMVLFGNENEIVIFLWSKLPMDSCHSQRKTKQPQISTKAYQVLHELISRQFPDLHFSTLSTAFLQFLAWSYADFCPRVFVLAIFMPGILCSLI